MGVACGWSETAKFKRLTECYDMHHFATEEVRTSPRVIQWNLSIVATDTESSHFAMATSPDPSCTNPVQVVYIQPTAYIKTKNAGLLANTTYRSH